MHTHKFVRASDMLGFVCHDRSCGLFVSDEALSGLDKEAVTMIEFDFEWASRHYGLTTVMGNMDLFVLAGRGGNNRSDPH